MTGSVLQFSESTVVSLEARDDDSMAVRFDKAFLVKSEGIPYADASTLWTQAGELLIEDAEMDGDVPELPATLATGSMECNGYKFIGMVQIPLQAEGYAELNLQFLNGVSVVVRGAGAKLQLEDTARYVKHMEAPEK